MDSPSPHCDSFHLTRRDGSRVACARCDLAETTSTGQRRRLAQLNEQVLAALADEAELALSIRLASGWGEIARQVDAASDALRKRMRDGDRFDRSLAWFVAKELAQIAREIRLNLNLRSEPQWPN
jgi:hypothetical protein